MADSILRLIGSFLKAMIVPEVKGFWGEFQQHRKNLPLRNLVQDMLFVARGLWLFLLFDLLVLIFFIVLPQGADIILSILENTGASFLGTLFCLIPALFFWSIVSELGTRYRMYVTDNSGMSLSEERVNWRKFLQRLFSRFALFYPVFILFLSFIIVALRNFPLDVLKKRWDLLGILGLFYLLFVGLHRLYHSVRQGSQWFGLSEQEKDWTGKLYGIYKQYVFSYPVPEALRESQLDSMPFEPSEGGKIDVAVSTKMKAGFTPDQEALLDFPQNALNEDASPLVREEFSIVRFFKGSKDLWGKWTYSIPISFFRRLHPQLFTLTGISIALIILFCGLDNGLYQKIGAPAVVVFAFACWTGVYIGYIFLERAALRWVRIRISWLLVPWVIFCTAHGNHPVRLSSDSRYKPRLTMKEHFRRWVNGYIGADSSSLRIPDSTSRAWNIDRLGGYPVVFICAEGGASRTGAFTSILLSKIQDRYPNFNRKICAYSTVSGGSVGIALYNALTNFRHKPDVQRENEESYAALSKAFFLKDHLANALGRLFFGEILQLFVPCHLDLLDRAVALEVSWQEGYEATAVQRGDINVFGSDYFTVYDTNKTYPAWFINTSCAETGLQSWLTNVIPDSSMPNWEEKDVWRMIPGTTRYSTAVNFSSRFPIISPAATIHTDDCVDRNFEDGGYVENYGAQTMVDYLRSLNGGDSPIRRRNIVPIVLMLEFGEPDEGRPAGKGFERQWYVIPEVLLNIRQARAHSARDELDTLVRSLNGKLIELPLPASTATVPLNWILSNRAVDSIGARCDTMLGRDRRLQLLLDILKASPGKGG